MEKNQIKICSDPYRKHIYYFWYEENGIWSDMEQMDESPLNADRFISSPISHNAYDMFKMITEKLYNSTVGMRIVFEGTDDDFDDLSSVKEIYYSDYNIELVRGSKKMKLAKEVMPQIESSFDKLKKYFKEYPDPETKNVIAKFTDAVKPEIAICVMGLYSSGKSAFINSIIGQEILPSESEPATAKIYRIKESNKCEISFCYQGQEYTVKFTETEWKVTRNPNSDICKLIKETIEENEPKSVDQFMYWTLYAINCFAKREGKKRHDELVACANKLLNEVELKNIESDEERIEKLLKKYRIKELVKKKELTPNKLDDVICVHVNFVHSYLPRDKFKFVIYDTPGTNSVMFREHADILKESLEQQTNGLPVFVTKPDSMDETDNNEIIAIINELGGALDVSNMMLIVNKSDEKSKSTLQKKVDNKDNLVLTKWKASRVYFVSSIIGLGGKKKDPENDKEWIDEDYYTVFLEKMDKFSNPESKLYMRLFDYNILPNDSKERIAKRIDGINESELLIWNSGIPCVEEEIGVFAQKYALYNKCSQAIQYLTDAVSMVEEDIYEAESKAEQLRVDIEKNLDEKKKSLVELLNTECQSMKKQFTSDFVNVVSNDCVRKYLNEERINEVISGIYKECHGKNEFEKLKPFNEKVEVQLKKDISGYSKETSSKTESYWEKCADELRTALMKIVVETPHLSDDQKEILKKEVFKVAMVSDAHKTLNITNTSAIKNKGKKLLWIFDLTSIDKKKSCEEYKKSLREDIETSSKKVIADNEKSLDKWINKLLNKLETVISSFNPDLVRLSEDLKSQNKIIEVKEKQKEFIGHEKIRIERLLEFEGE